MKLLFILLTISLVGCASTHQSAAMSYSEVESIKLVDSRDCQNADRIIAQMNKQLELKGFLNKNPEDLPTEEDRKYNSRVKVVIWSLRIGCNNPNRYK